MIIIKVYDWEFRRRMDGIVESKNENKGLAWARRNPRDMDLLDDQISFIGDAIAMCHSIFPEIPVEMPKDGGVLVQQPVEHTKIM